MKYAICYRGISYKEHYITEEGADPFDIDFDNCIDSNLENIINPLRNLGNHVDIFFNTYHSNKLNEFISKLNPVNVISKEFSENIKKNNFYNITNIIIESLNQIKQYQLINNIKYDYIILSRFDIFIFQNFTNIFIPENSISVPTRNDDCFIVISGDLLDTAIDIYTKNRNVCITHHMVYKFLENGIRYHSMFANKPGDEVSYNAPLWRLSRVIFSADNSNLKQYNLQDIFNKKSKYYGFKYKSHNFYFGCDDKNLN